MQAVLDVGFCASGLRRKKKTGAFNTMSVRYSLVLARPVAVLPFWAAVSYFEFNFRSRLSPPLPYSQACPVLL